MKLARVVGTVVATIKDESLVGQKILLIDPLDENLKKTGGTIAAIDSVQAGTGDLVHYTLSREASLVLENSFSPIDAAITGIVDQVNIETKEIYNKEIFNRE